MMSRSVVDVVGPWLVLEPGLASGMVLAAGVEAAGESGAAGALAFLGVGFPLCCAINSPSGSELADCDLDGICWAINASKGSMA